ncbi:hypothetical protein AAC387_Pa06g2257 [Persea americana]
MFYNITIGEEPHRMYGLFQCRGDITADQCKGCLEISSIEIKQTCPNSTQGVLWYDFCLVQYSNQHFFGSIQTDGFYYYNNKFDRPPFGQVDKALEFVLNLSKQVPSRPSMFATAASSSESIYSLVQCTMDISKEGCQSCLKDVIGKIKGCCSWSRGWRFFTPSCSLRYETYLFFNGSTDHEELQHQYCPNDLSSGILEFNNNLNRLLLTLTSYAPASGFYNAYFGDDPHIVYGLVLCRGDLDRTRCQECLNTAWNDLMITCPNETEAILWYSECQLRYSNQSFFGVADTDGFYDLSNVDDSIGNQSLQAIYGLVKKASEEKLMFTADQLLVNGSEKRFFYAQCTRDIDSNSCHDCLKELIQKVMKCCINMRGWQYYAASCYMRFEDYLFFNIPEVMTPVPQPTPLLQLSPATPPIRHEVVPDRVSREGKKRKSTHVLAISLTVAFLALSLLGLSIFFLLRRKSKKKGRKQHRHHALFNNSGPSGIEVLNTHISGGIQVETQELLLIDFDTIQLATNKFSSENKLGEGGFGAVYKGILPDGKEIAVKRLSKCSNQGLKEFKNEVILISKLQHKNLVRLLFCCMEKEEMLLIYEYMPNTSLDCFLFDPTKHADLSWTIRLNIINGIARGLLYLHQDSRLNIIHRDLKASNVLLDNEMNPKISDFGLARPFRENQGEANTNIVVGT